MECERVTLSQSILIGGISSVSLVMLMLCVFSGVKIRQKIAAERAEKDRIVATTTDTSSKNIESDKSSKNIESDKSSKNVNSDAIESAKELN